MLSREVQSWNASLPIFCSPLFNVIFLKLVQPSNACAFIRVTEEGSTTLSNEVHWQNAPIPIFLSPSLNTTSRNRVHRRNAWGGTWTTLGWNFTRTTSFGTLQLLPANSNTILADESLAVRQRFTELPAETNVQSCSLLVSSLSLLPSPATPSPPPLLLWDITASTYIPSITSATSPEPESPSPLLFCEAIICKFTDLDPPADFLTTLPFIVFFRI